MTDSLVLYVVHPEQRGVQAHSVPTLRTGPLLQHTVPQPVTLTSSELEYATVELCRVEPGRVCPHGWFCTTDLRTAQFVDELRGERADVVVFVRGARLDGLADAIERGEHRREEGA
jgi:hypothetical protein